MISAFAKMINDGLCTIDDLPEEYKIPVSEYKDSPIKPNKINEVRVSTLNGALYLGKYENYPIDINELNRNGYVDTRFKTSSIFVDYINEYPLPKNISFNIIRCDEVFCGFTSDPYIELFVTDMGFDIRIHGSININDVPENTPLMRIDLSITSSDYEEMHYTIYFKSK